MAYPDERNTVGIDLGLKDFAVLSTGEKIPNPKFARNLAVRLAILQKRASRKQKGSSNRRKANIAVAKCHEKIRNRRRHFLHVLSSRLLSEHDCIAIETLSPSNIAKNHSLAGSVYDASWSEFVRMLEYKAVPMGKRVMKI